MSWLAADDAAAFPWRQDFIATFLQRDLPAVGLRVPAETLRRFWTMLAHLQGQLFNASALGQSLGGASHHTAILHLDTLVDTLMVRRLEPHLVNLDLVIEHRGKKVGIEIKFIVAPKPARGFWLSLKDVQISTARVIAPALRRCPLVPSVEVIPLHELGEVTAALEG